jgi:transposase
MFHIGIDAHLNSSAVCILDENGGLFKRFIHRGDLRCLVRRLEEELDQPFQACFEASCGGGTLHDLLTPIARRVVVAHPGHLRLIFRSKKKNDRVDAAKLAKLLFLDEVPPVHVPDRNVRAWREMIGMRSQAVAKRTRAKNGLRALLRSYLIRSPRGLWTKEGRQWLAELKLPTASARLRRDLLLEEVKHFDRQIRRLEQELDRIARRHAGVTLLQTIPGIGPRTAEAFCAFVDDPQRFGAKQIGPYFGLTPSQDQSGSTNRLGHITREGPAVVRRLLTEAAWRASRLSPRVKAFFERVQRGDPDRKKIAVVATGHYLARVMLAMLQSGEVWQKEVAPGTKAA